MKNTQDFLEEILKNENFARKFENIKDFEVLKEKAKSEGYDISKEEYKKLENEAKNRVTDKDLEMTAGGLTSQDLKDFGDGFKEGFGFVMDLGGTVVDGAVGFGTKVLKGLAGLFG